MRSLLILIPLLLAVAPAAQAKPPLCTTGVIEATLTGAGHPTEEGAGVNLIRCGDLTGDGAADVLFTVASGGTAGDTHFGVIEGGGVDGGGEVVLYKDAYSVGVARHDASSF